MGSIKTGMEVEVRILLKNRAKVEANLKQKGARLVYVTRLKDYWFCPKSVGRHQEASIDKTGFALRIREARDPYSGRLMASMDCKTLFEPHSHAVCHEHEMEVPNVLKARKILESIGLKNFLLVDKERMVYRLKNALFCFDNIKGVGHGLEIEMKAKKDTHEVYQKVLALAKEIEVGKDEILKKSLTYIAMQKLSKF